MSCKQLEWQLGERCRVPTGGKGRGSCDVAATHKLGEEGGREFRGHNLTAYVCCKHFVMVVGSAAPCAGAHHEAAAARNAVKQGAADPAFVAARHRGWFSWAGVVRLFDRTCAYCQRAAGATGPLTREHVVPVSDGGNGFAHANIVPACHECNLAKGRKSLAEFATAVMTHRYRAPHHWHPRLLALLDGAQTETSYFAWCARQKKIAATVGATVGN